MWLLLNAFASRKLAILFVSLTFHLRTRETQTVIRAAVHYSVRTGEKKGWRGRRKHLLKDLRLSPFARYPFLFLFSVPLAISNEAAQVLGTRSSLDIWATWQTTAALAKLSRRLLLRKFTLQKSLHICRHSVTQCSSWRQSYDPGKWTWHKQK